MKKKHIIIIIIVIAGLICSYAGYKGIRSFLDLRRYQQQVKEIRIENVDLGRIPDGIYIGSAEVLWIAAEVKVQVKDHSIIKIDLIKHKNGRGGKAEAIPAKVVEAQSLQVEAISGATNSSKVILKAIENALRSAE